MRACDCFAFRVAPKYLAEATPANHTHLPTTPTYLATTPIPLATTPTHLSSQPHTLTCLSSSNNSVSMLSFRYSSFMLRMTSSMTCLYKLVCNTGRGKEEGRGRKGGEREGHGEKKKEGEERRKVRVGRGCHWAIVVTLVL